MPRLTDQQYWDAKYTPDQRGADERNEPSSSWFGRMKRLLGPRAEEYMRSYPEYVLWNVLYPRDLPHEKGARVLEIGSAPGEHLVQLWKRFGYEPFGVEFSEQGVRLNRSVFVREGLDPANVIHSDFLSPGFQNRYKDFFDIVLSRGLIEHFTDLERILDAHLNVLRNGGHLVVSVPNLRGLNHAFAYFFNKANLPLHNRSIMRRDAFRSLFGTERLSTLLCRYYGVFSFGIFNAPPDTLRRRILRLCGMVQNALNFAFRAAFGSNGPDTKYLSPYLLFIGIKKR